MIRWISIIQFGPRRFLFFWPKIRCETIRVIIPDVTLDRNGPRLRGFADSIQRMAVSDYSRGRTNGKDGSFGARNFRAPARLPFLSRITFKHRLTHRELATKSCYDRFFGRA
jgi:hypothetical protein